jgi:hypothetical protein
MVARTPENSSLLLFGTNQSLSFVDQEPVNMPTANNVILISIIIPMLLSILLVNIMSIILIKKRESTLVNNLLTLDCTANALITVINSIQQYKAVGLELYCAPVTVFYSRCFVEQTCITCLICFRRYPW